MLATIALFVYNRPWHTKLTIESLRKNKGASDSNLIIFSDGPKSGADIEHVAEVRKYLRSVNGFLSVEIRESQSNKGLADSIITGVASVLEKHEEIIVLEDDMVTSPYFLSYMNQGLSLYRIDDRVISVHGYIYPVKGSLPQSFFVRGAHCWGWGTWRRGWKYFEPDGKKLLKELVDRKLAYDFDYDGSYPFTKMLSDQIQGLNNSWAIRWHASAFLNNKLTLYPGESFVKNIGFDSSGTHSVASDRVYDSEIQMTDVKLERIEAEELKKARMLLIKFFRSIKVSLARRVLSKFKRIIYRTIKG